MSHQDPTKYLTEIVPKPDLTEHPRGESGDEVTVGECASSLSYKAGHFWETIWNHIENKSLKEARPDPHVLMPGDRLFIPPIEPKNHDCATDARHRFRLRGVPEKLRIRLLIGDKPRAEEPYLLQFSTKDGEKYQEGTTDGDGKLEEWIPPRTMNAVLFLRDDTFDLELGQLQPPDTMEGAIFRLVNLGLLPDEAVKDDIAFRTALGAFQRNRGIDVTFSLDPLTTQALDDCYKNWQGGLSYDE